MHSTLRRQPPLCPPCPLRNWGTTRQTRPLEEAKRRGRLHARRRAHDRAEPRVVDHDPLMELLSRPSPMQDSSESREPAHSMSIEAHTETASVLGRIRVLVYVIRTPVLTWCQAVPSRGSRTTQRCQSRSRSSPAAGRARTGR